MISIKESLILTLLSLCLTASIHPSLSSPLGIRCARVSNQPTCVCRTTDGLIDLTNLASRDGPRFQGLPDSNGFVYSYNPCYPFSVSGSNDCSDVHICQASGSSTYPIADKGTEQMWIDDNNQPYVYYTSSSGTNYREVFVKLKCDTNAVNPEVTTEGDNLHLFTYIFTVTTKHACPVSGGTAAGVVGIVLMIMFIAGIIGYIVIGAIIMKVHFNKNGLDIVPQKMFWFVVPGLIMEGFVFTSKSMCGLTRALFNRLDRSGYKQEL